MAITEESRGRQMTTETRADQLNPPSQRDIPQRALAAVGLIAIALIHYADASSKYAAADARYIFWLYVALILGCALGVGLLILRHTRLVWAAAALLAAAPFVSYVINRTTGLPRATDDVGNWLEPLDVASLIVEVLLFVLALVQMRRTRRNRSVGLDAMRRLVGAGDAPGAVPWAAEKATACP